MCHIFTVMKYFHLEIQQVCFEWAPTLSTVLLSYHSHHVSYHRRSHPTNRPWRRHKHFSSLQIFSCSTVPALFFSGNFFFHLNLIPFSCSRYLTASLPTLESIKTTQTFDTKQWKPQGRSFIQRPTSARVFNKTGSTCAFPRKSKQTQQIDTIIPPCTDPVVGAALWWARLVPLQGDPSFPLQQ